MQGELRSHKHSGGEDYGVMLWGYSYSLAP